LINFRDGVFEDLFIWTDSIRYNLSNNKKATGVNIGQIYNANVDEPLFIELNFSLGSIGNPLNWALADADGNLYLAVNQIKYDGSFENINKVYFNFVDTRY
jgi:hypothetical protein